VKLRAYVLAGTALLALGASGSPYPMVDAAAQKVIAKYQQASCEQLWEARGAPKTPQEQNMIEVLKSDPAVRKVFIDEVAGPVVNRMFECGLVP